MTDTFATRNDLVARLSAAYTAPADPEATKLLTKASELIDHVTNGAAQEAFDGTDPDLATLLANAACDQVEFWLETGEEHDVLGLRGQLAGGRVQVQNVPGRLGPRTKQTLLRAGLLWSGVGAF